MNGPILKKNMEIAVENISEVSRQKMSNTHKGRPRPWRIGLTHSEETKQKIRLARLGQKLNEETKQKIAKKLTGRQCSEETRRNISCRQCYK